MRGIIATYGTAIAGLAIVVFFVGFAPNFATPANIVNVLKDTSFLAILGLGFTLALVVSELDLSIAEISSLAAVTSASIVRTPRGSVGDPGATALRTHEITRLWPVR